MVLLLQYTGMISLFCNSAKGFLACQKEDTRQTTGNRQVNLRKESRIHCWVTERKASQNEEGFETEGPVMTSYALSDGVGEGFFIA